MFVKAISCVGLAAAGFVWLGGVALAQTAGPAEFPPSDYAGQSYVDSQGCIFLKAGYGGNVTWVARVGQDRRAICGQTPTLAVSNVAYAAAEGDAADYGAEPAVTPRARTRTQAHVTQRAPVTIGCPQSVPVARRYATTDGGSVVLCTAKNGSLTGARSPIYPPGSGVGAALSAARPSGVVIPLGKRGAAQATAGFVPPKGYEVAWKDGRLNPLRGRGTAAGQAAQDEIWTRDVPAVAVVAKPKSRRGMQTTVSASNQSGAGIYIQVGAFGQPANAKGAAARLAALGLPVATAKSGNALQVVYAGPFASNGDARAALVTARRSGFSDAFIK